MRVFLPLCFLALFTAAMAQLDTNGRVTALFAEWQALIRQAVASDAENLEQVNGFFNRHLQFQNDQVVWGEKDYWATPRETMRRGSGDCEDFVIAKYFTLLDMGMPPEKLRLIYVRAMIGGADSGYSQAHMVLGYYASETAEPLILDNLVSEVRPASRRPDLLPIFSFNTQGLWARGQSSSVDPTTRLSRWRNLLARLSEEQSMHTSQSIRPSSKEVTDHVTQ